MMNKNLRNMIERAETKEHGYYFFDREKFAELIIERCIDIVSNGGEFASRPKLVEKLKEHFGVKE